MLSKVWAGSTLAGQHEHGQRPVAFSDDKDILPVLQPIRRQNTAATEGFKGWFCASAGFTCAKMLKKRIAQFLVGHHPFYCWGERDAAKMLRKGDFVVQHGRLLETVQKFRNRLRFLNTTFAGRNQTRLYGVIRPNILPLRRIPRRQLRRRPLGYCVLSKSRSGFQAERRLGSW